MFDSNLPFIIVITLLLSYDLAPTFHSKHPCSINITVIIFKLKKCLICSASNEYLPCARHCCRCWDTAIKLNPCPCGHPILVILKIIFHEMKYFKHTKTNILDT